MVDKRRSVTCSACGARDTLYFEGEWDPADWPGGPSLCPCPSSGYVFGPVLAAATNP